MTSPHILLVAGSLRADSFTTKLLVTAGDLVPGPLGVELVDHIRDLPHYDPDLEGDDLPLPVVALRAAIADAAGLLIATPEYNGAVPGGLKDWFDWATRPFGAHALMGKPVAVIGASPSSRGAAGAVTWLRTVLGFLGANLVGEVVAIPSVIGEIGADGTVSDAVTAQLRSTAEALAAAVAAAG